MNGIALRNDRNSANVNISSSENTATKKDKKVDVNPVFWEKGVRIYQGDVIDTLSKFPEGSIDLIFADPPYNLSNDGFTCHAGRRVSVNKGDWDKSNGIESDFEFHSEWINACRRILKDDGSLWISGTYHSIYSCGFALQMQGWHLINDISWFKPNASPNLSCRMFTASHETLLWARKTKKSRHVFNYPIAKNGTWESDFLKKPGKQMRSVWALHTPKAQEKKFGKHPTQKPEELLERIILTSSKPGAIVLDPFCGSGTTGVAAVRNGRKFIGVDLDAGFLKNLCVPRILAEVNKNQENLKQKKNKVSETRNRYLTLLP